MQNSEIWTFTFTILMLVKGSYAPIKPLAAMRPFGARSVSTFSRSMFAIHNDLKDELRGSWPKPIRESDACSQDLQCLSLRTHSECKNGKCQCVSGHKPYQEMCVHKEFFTGESFEKMSNCTNDPQCNMDLYSSRCVNGRCDCGVAGKGPNGICKKGDLPKTLYPNVMFTKPWLHQLQYQTRMTDLVSATTALILPATVISIRLPNYDRSNNFDPSTVNEFKNKKIDYRYTMASENFYQMLINVMNLWGEVLHEFGEQGRRNFANPDEEQALFQYRSALIRLIHEFPGDHKKAGRSSMSDKLTAPALPGDDFQGFLDLYEIHMRNLTDKVRTIARDIVLTILCTTDALLAFHYKNRPDQNIIKKVEKVRQVYGALIDRLDAIDYIVREREDQVHNLTKKFILIYGHSMQAKDQGMLIRPSKASYYPSNLLLDAAALLPNYMPTVIDGRVGQLQVVPSYVVKNRQDRLHADIETTLLLTLSHAWYNHMVGFAESCDMLYLNYRIYESDIIHLFEIEMRTANMIVQMIRDNVKQPHNNLAQMVIARYQGLSKVCGDAIANIRGLAPNEDVSTLIDVFRRSVLDEWNKFRPLEAYLEFAGYSGFSNYFMNLTFTKHPKNELNELFPMTKIHMRTRLVQQAVANEVNGKVKGPILKSLKDYFDKAKQFVENPLMKSKSKITNAELSEKFLMPMLDFLQPLANSWSTLAMHSASGLLRARMINNDASLSYIVENLKERKEFDLFLFLMADRGDVTLKMSMLRQVYDLEKIRTYVSNTLRGNIDYVKKVYSFRDHWRNDIFKVSVMIESPEDQRQKDAAYLQNVVLTECGKGIDLSKTEIDAIERQYKANVDLHKKSMDDNSQLNPAPLKSADNLEQKIFDVLKKYWKADDGRITDWPGFKLSDFQ